MDRRTFLAFGLIFLILVGSQAIMRKFYGKPATPGAADSTAVVADAEMVAGAGNDLNVDEQRSAAEDPAEVDRQEVFQEVPTGSDSDTPLTAAEALMITGGAHEQVIRINTPLYRAELSTRGGRFISWQGLPFESYLGGPVQLVPEDIPASGTDAIVFRQGELDLGSTIFLTDAPADLEVREGGGTRSIELTANTGGGLQVRKILSFDPETYNISVDVVVVAAEANAQRSLDLTGSPESFRFGWNQGISPTERNQRMEEPALRAAVRVGDEYHYKKRMDLKKSVEKVEGRFRGSVHFAALQNKYFTVIGIVPQEQGEPVEGAIRISGNQELMAQSWAIDIPAHRGVGSEIATARLDLFIGPQEAELLASYNQGLEKAMDLGWKLFRPLSEGVLWVMEKMHRYISNYGLIIILFSVITKLMFYPLTRSSTTSMKKMQELQPKLKALQEKYKNDKDKLNQATMKLYQEEKVNPLAGCLPLLVQSPVFIALYQALNHTISLRGQPFVAWIQDLSQPDALTQLPFALPFLGSDLNVLPILMALAMYFQTKLTPTSGGGQMAAMNTMMPLIMIFIFYNMPSGLVLYWLVNTLMQIYQSWKIHKTAPATGGAQTA